MLKKSRNKAEEGFSDAELAELYALRAKKNSKLSEIIPETIPQLQMNDEEQHDMLNQVEKIEGSHSLMKNVSAVDKIKEKVSPHKTYLIDMEMRNGMHSTFMISTNKNNFKFLKNTYIIDTNMKYYNINSKVWCLRYHQDIALPIKQEIPVRDILLAFKQGGMTTVENAINPSTLENFIEAKIAEGVMKGQQIDEYFKQIKLLIIVAVVSSVIHLMLFVFKTGMLSKVSIPGLK